MVEIYVRKILDGEMTLESVPKLWREKVKNVLDSRETSSK